MPNGVSCAFFAARNFMLGQKEKNIFKEGVAVAQTTRTVDSIAQSAVPKTTASVKTLDGFGKAAAIAKKIVYPLIITSGVYNTIKSDDKIKTGTVNALSIGSMYSFEKITEKALNNINKLVLSSEAVQGSKKLKIAWYVLKGLLYSAASLAGYKTGEKGGNYIADKIKGRKEYIYHDTEEQNIDIYNTDNTTFEDMDIDEDFKEESPVSSEEYRQAAT